ncbi:MAG: hypothetical protein JEZ07_20370 [Phycisphaerae bacterium]|nr:hypothetical protein [Phycisphaerae bacterium]
MKRFILLPLLLAIFATTNANAAINGSGTELDPYLINSVEDFELWRTNTAMRAADKFTRLETDIDFNNQSFNNYVAPGVVVGTVDGNGHKILNFTINYTVGFFSGITGTVKNLSLINATINSANSCGILAGTIQTTGRVENCYINGTMTIGGTHFGAIAATNDGVISRCGVDAVLFETGTSIYSNAGIIVNYNSGRIEDTYAKGIINGDIWRAGFVNINSSTAVIENCYSDVQIDTAINTSVYGFVHSQDGTVNNCFWNTDKAPNITLGAPNNNAGIIGLTTAQMQNIAHYINADWDFTGETINGTDDIWTIIAGDMPILSWQADGSYCLNPPFFDYNGDCLVNMVDFAAFASTWLSCGYANQSLCP